ncbi:hypothetical protein WR25_14275 [Diploscapter pachys]|uniref:Uncharacterized protein n=1 Tax=Diploscapter pachys TaxID=2018661 RepID=A0A2A2LVN5_9BILA|nr:hypothetical protein WR25_14275 [Diploscapter pachys]
MMANSAYEYGGTNLEDLDKLDAIRKEIPRDDSRDRHRAEDDPDSDQEPIYSESGKLLASIAPESGKGKNLTEKVNKIKELPEISRKIRQTREKSNEQSDNPFEEIATRPPLNQRNLFRQVKNRLSNERRHRHKHKERLGFLTRDDIIKSHRKTTTTTPFPKLVDSDEVELEKNERLGGRMDQEQSENLKVHPINDMLKDDVWRNGGEFVFLSGDEELASRVRGGFGELVVGVH